MSWTDSVCGVTKKEVEPGRISICEMVGRPHFPGVSRRFGATQDSACVTAVAKAVRTIPVASPAQLIGKVTTTAEQQGNDEMLLGITVHRSLDTTL